METSIKNKENTISIRRDNSISLIRVASMTLIILTHILSEISQIAFLAHITTAAVYTFLFISGYLFGTKKITDSKKWMKKRMTRLLVPSYIYLIFLFAYKIATNNLGFSTVVTYVLNLQGIFGGTNGASHFWFMTTIMLCYFITPVLYKTKDKFLNLSINTRLLFFIISIFIWIAISLVTPAVIGNNIGYLLFYSLAFYLGAVWDREVSNKNFIVLTMLTLTSMVFRSIMKNNFDGSMLYDVVVVSICQSFIGMYIFILFDRMKFIVNNTTAIKIINHFDELSFEIFITHYAFITGPFFIWGISDNIIIDSILVLIASYLSGKVLKKVSDGVILKI